MKNTLFIAMLFLVFTASAQIETSNLVKVSVTSVFDGDGCNVLFPGRTHVERLRFVGIDAPERRGYSLKAQPYGNQAGDTLRALIDNKQILIDTAVLKKGSRDVYGRLLVNAYTMDTVNIQFLMVEKGLAWATFTAGLKEPKLNDVLEFEHMAAKTEKRGLWLSYVTKDGKIARIYKPETWRKNYSIKRE
jgi:endonuclease YncB( thermonuclease family)